MNKFKKLELPIYEDERGYLSSLWKNDNKIIYQEDRLSYSKYGVLRGLHGDMFTGKYFILLDGEIEFYCKSLISNFFYFGKVNAYKNKLNGFYIPPRFINGHLCLSTTCKILYKWTEFYSGPENQFTVKWDDSYLNVPWSIKTPILSERDKNGVLFKELKI